MSGLSVNRREIGREGEREAIKFLERNGFRIIKKNFYTKWGEIDIIAFKDNTLYFIEVKKGSFFNPAENITKKKLEHLKRAIKIYLSKNRIEFDYTLAAIIIEKDKIDFIDSIYGL